MSHTLQPHGLQHARFPCPSLSPRICSNSCPLRWWCHPNISSSVVPLLLLPSVFPSIRVFSSESVLPFRWPKYWSLNFSISPQGWFPSGLTSLIKTPCLVFCKTDSHPPIFIKCWLQQKPANTNTNRRKRISERISGDITQITGKNAVRCQEQGTKKCQNWSFSAFISAFAYFSFLLFLRPHGGTWLPHSFQVCVCRFSPTPIPSF